MPHLFDPLTLRGLTIPNRVFVSPMCEYSATDGFPTDWHLVHLGSRAVGGAGLVIAEATAVRPEGRISPQDVGLWSDAHVDPFERIVRFVHAQGARAGVQLAHAGRKASTFRPWEGDGTVGEAEGGWTTVVAPSAIPHAEHYPTPSALTEGGIRLVIDGFVSAGLRACAAGFDVLEIHAAHGYLLHQFLSPLSNQRDDGWGGGFEGRTRLLREVVSGLRAACPDHIVLFVRLSATDWTEGGWDLEQTIALVRMLAPLGVDLIDCSTGGNVHRARIPVGPGYQVPFAAAVRRETGVPTTAVGLITSAVQAEQLVSLGEVDAVQLARELLRDPYWPLHAARELAQPITWPVQYLRAAPPGTRVRVPVEPLG